MNYIDTRTLAYPLTPADIRAANQGVIFPEPFEPCEGYSPVAWQAIPAHNVNTQKAVEVAPVIEEGSCRQAFEIVSLTAAEKAEALAIEKARLLDAATAKRWEVETGGVTFPDGTRIGTTLDDQNRITTVIANAQLAGVTTVDFKAATGWITLTLTELQGIAAAIALHVQECFTVERGHHEAIGALTLAQARAYDVGQGWPT